MSKIGSTSHVPSCILTLVPSGIIRGIFSINPPPVIWLKPFTSTLLIRSSTGFTYILVGVRSASPRVQPSFSIYSLSPLEVGLNIFLTSEYPFEWIPLEAIPIRTSPLLILLPSMALVLSIMPTVKPARSYSSTG